MSFRDHLTTLVNAVEGSMAATVMGLDGIAIDVCSVPGSPPDLDTAFIEGSGLMTSARRIADSLGSGGVSELALATGEWTLLARMVTGDYFVALVLGPAGLPGKGRFYLRRAALDLRHEIGE